MLVRRLLQDRLARYYAQPAHAVVGSFTVGNPAHAGNALSSPSSSSLPFSSLWGEWHWKRLYRRLYEEQRGQWLTPVELFRPYYSRAVARFAVETVIKQQQQQGREVDSVPWEIIEVGGGRGTNAIAILDFLKSEHPELYVACQRYTLVDSSPTLHELQRQVLQHSSHHPKVDFRLLDLMDVAEGRESMLLASSRPQSAEENAKPRTAPVHSVVLALEVLDNLPHDKVRIRNQRKGKVEWEQAEVESRRANGSSGTGTSSQQLEKHVDGTSDSTGAWREVFRPLHDPLLRQIIKVVPSDSASSMAPVWIPSVACGVVLALARELRELHQTQIKSPSSSDSRHRSLSLLAADFDWLPPPDRFDPRKHTSPSSSITGGSSTTNSYMPGVGEPLVTCMDGYDHRCYLDAPVLSDVFFPTDFGRLATFCQSAFESANFRCRANVRKQSDFLRQYDDAATSEIDRTKSWLTGYSPLLDDFANCSVLTVNVTCSSAKGADNRP